jgi:glutamyl-tRNA reductase
MEPCLMIIGLDFWQAPPEVRERFWISKPRQGYALAHLLRMPGVEEVVLMAGWERTAFILWSSDFCASSDSMLTFLTREYQLRFSEWSHFYRMIGDDALRHLFRLACRLEPMVVEHDVATELKDGWMRAQRARASGPMLDAIFAKALAVSASVRPAGPEPHRNGHGDEHRREHAENVVAAALRDFQAELDRLIGATAQAA